MHRPDTLHPIHFHADPGTFSLPQKPFKKRWTSPLPHIRIDAFDIMPLTSFSMLKSEGYNMNNCCKDYAPLCAEGTYLLFSIRDHAGERLATMGVEKVDDHYHLDQCFGPSNSNVTDLFIHHLDEDDTHHTEWQRTEIFFVASEVVRMLNGVKTN